MNAAERIVVLERLLGRVQQNRHRTAARAPGEIASAGLFAAGAPRAPGSSEAPADVESDEEPGRITAEYFIEAGAVRMRSSPPGVALGDHSEEVAPSVVFDEPVYASPQPPEPRPAGDASELQTLVAPASKRAGVADLEVDAAHSLADVAAAPDIAPVAPVSAAESVDIDDVELFEPDVPLVSLGRWGPNPAPVAAAVPEPAIELPPALAEAATLPRGALDTLIDAEGPFATADEAPVLPEAIVTKPLLPDVFDVANYVGDVARAPVATFGAVLAGSLTLTPGPG